MAEARKHGFHYGHSEWANLGQGAPETGEIPGSPARLTQIPLADDTYEYGPVVGINELRSAVADLYNQRYRRGMSSRYSMENVAISSGGRAGLTRVAAALGNIHLGHFLPDYTAYEELLELFKAFVPMPILLESGKGFGFDVKRLFREVMGQGLGAVLMSNPCNPTGQVMFGEDLAEWIDIGRTLQCAQIFDEFYSHYLYDEAAKASTSLSACAYVEDVERDGVVILDGLTKNWRYPGLRLSWTVGPKEIIRRIGSAGSFLDGGPPHPVQRAVLPLLDSAVADAEARAIQRHFSVKRARVLERLTELGFSIKGIPQGAFYFFVGLEGLPEPLRDGMAFFQAALERQVICVPGEFFDVNPGKRRSHIPSRLRGFVRISFGPAIRDLEMGLDRLGQMMADYR
ncbi:Pyridoxal phosphate-dependent aminotransferase [Sulfidibacter corallicola]|uniref:Pyridoxal phosphate-dependent aminotransferase n=1 Tax=Sulfidibacter corallicola TaxID=2818388 RepID=A0A8A4TVH2_SULCO|nr:pyridoxal phosphate-dependent aminotransferase [Sulfidibacter corallicola]QTD53946.1 pyridoxal phosphate-dependent aminotransferase [Sulfidibacter corallicola]